MQRILPRVYRSNTIQKIKKNIQQKLPEINVKDLIQEDTYGLDEDKNLNSIISSLLINSKHRKSKLYNANPAETNIGQFWNNTGTCFYFAIINAFYNCNKTQIDDYIKSRHDKESEAEDFLINFLFNPEKKIAINRYLKEFAYTYTWLASLEYLLHGAVDKNEKIFSGPGALIPQYFWVKHIWNKLERMIGIHGNNAELKVINSRRRVDVKISLEKLKDIKNVGYVWLIDGHAFYSYDGNIMNNMMLQNDNTKTTDYFIYITKDWVAESNLKKLCQEVNSGQIFNFPQIFEEQFKIKENMPTINYYL